MEGRGRSLGRVLRAGGNGGIAENDAHPARTTSLFHDDDPTPPPPRCKGTTLSSPASSPGWASGGRRGGDLRSLGCAEALFHSRQTAVSWKFR